MALAADGRARPRIAGPSRAHGRERRGWCGLARETVATDLREQAESLGARLGVWLADLALRRPVPASTDQLRRLLRDAMAPGDDLAIRRVTLGGGVPVLVAAIDGLVADVKLNHFVLTPLLAEGRRRPSASAAEVARWLRDYGLPAGRVTRVRTMDQVLEQLLRGSAVVHVDGATEALAVNVRTDEHRSAEEPATETVIRGPREGFVEVLRYNTLAIRRRLATPRLRIEELSAGGTSRTRVGILYVAGRADPGTVAEVRRRLAGFPGEIVASAQSIAALLEERTWSVFPQLRATERPDVCVAALSEGRVVILTDGDPFALIVPATFWDLLHSPDDYYQRWPFGTALRTIRLIAVLLMVGVLPAYVATVTFHQELMPTEFLLVLAASREGLPLPTLFEALLLNFAFDLIREASIRMPQPIGGALTIVGALIIGEAAVRGGFVSAPMVILIGLGAVSAFVIPAFATTIPFRILNYTLLVLAGTLGLFGMAMGLVVILAHLASLRSMGVPFLAPLAPLRIRGQEDVLVRLPWKLQRGRPPLVGEPVASRPDTR